MKLEQQKTCMFGSYAYSFDEDHGSGDDAGVVAEEEAADGTQHGQEDEPPR